MSDNRFPASPYPRGWFVVSWSHDLQPGEVKPLDYFGEKLVLWRGESGAAMLQDAFCLHLGAHRGIRGWVTGDQLNCPWHGWVWDGNGRNTSIPYSREGCKPNLQIRTYPVQEWCGAIMAWYDWDGGEPTWELPVIPEYANPDWHPMHPFSSRQFVLRAHVQMPIENTVDPAHVPLVHGAATEPIVENVSSDRHWFHAEVRVLYGGGKKSTRLTPNGPTESVFEANLYGIGLSMVNWRNPDLVPTFQFTGFTPIDAERMHYFFGQTSQRDPGVTSIEPTGRALAMLETQLKVIPQDFFTWENMKYLEVPNFAVEEAKNYSAFRRWAAQFYPESHQKRLSKLHG